MNKFIEWTRRLEGLGYIDGRESSFKAFILGFLKWIARGFE